MVNRRRKAMPAYPALIAALAVSGCEVDQAPIQRDVYAGKSVAEAMQQCVADWGSEELCGKLADAKVAEAAAKSHTGAGSGGGFVYIGGPGYYGDSRTATLNGRTYTPQSALSSTPGVRPVSVAKFSPSPTPGGKPSFHGISSSPRGGFGSMARGAGGASS